jgi:hypothetical protein
MEGGGSRRGRQEVVENDPEGDTSLSPNSEQRHEFHGELRVKTGLDTARTWTLDFMVSWKALLARKISSPRRSNSKLILEI